jgi:hypothetical protein
MDERDAIVESLLGERTVDIVSTGRRSGTARVTEIWTTVVEGQTYLCGTPNASKAGVSHQPRDWLANLAATPAFVVRLKTSVAVDLPATAELVRDAATRLQVLSAPHSAYYRDALGLDAALRHSPLVRVDFTGEAAWLNDALRQRAGG